ncbi:MAG: TPM domain-containing protein [Oscillospiraceae bacterium]|nr:TPM domain-containing protein [Oscillospiraceae bacterium]
MARGFAAVTLLFALCVSLCACTGKKPADSVTEKPSQSALETETTENTEETQKTTDTKQPVKDPNRDDPHIFDEMGLLSEQDVRVLSDAADGLAKKAALHAAVVLTEELDGSRPAQFAAEYYRELYEKDSTGFLVLVNNETGEDYVYTSGACSLYLEDAAIRLAVAQATPMLVEGKFRQGIEHLLNLGNQMPKLVYDSAGILSREQHDGFLTAAQELSDETKKRCGVLLVRSVEVSEEQELQEVMRAYADQQREQLEMDRLLVVAVDDTRCAVSGTEDAEELSAELTNVLQNTKRLPVTAAVNTYFEKIR